MPAGRDNAGDKRIAANQHNNIKSLAREQAHPKKSVDVMVLILSFLAIKL